MIVNDAKEALRAKYPELIPISCTEYLSRYVFDMRVKDYEGAKGVLDMLMSVDKKSGEIKTFHPFMMSKTEYENGNKVII